MNEHNRHLTMIAANGGVTVRTLLSGAKSGIFSDEKKVRSLVGTSPEYQRHVVERALAGDPNPCRRIAATLLVYDTVSFREVTSRLHRALGMIRQEATYLTRSIERGKQDRRLADRLLTMDLVAEQALLLRNLLTGIDPVTGTVGPGSKPSKSKSAPKDKLHAAGGLGLIAKNVFNVATLQPAHRPNRAQKELALRMTTDALELATTAGKAVRRKFGKVDSSCRVRPAQTPTRRVITHDKVDGDAVAAAWLAERFLFVEESVEVLFLPRERVLGAWRRGDCLVDVGNTHDVKNLFFDHKVPSGDRYASCAAELVLKRLMRLGNRLKDLRPLVNVVFAGDSLRGRAKFQKEYDESKRNGFHRALADAKSKYGDDDASVYRVMRTWLDRFPD